VKLSKRPEKSPEKSPEKRPERKKSAAKTAAILTGAMQEFLASGYAATSMDRVAAAAGVSKATVYSHFQDKAGLFAALVQQLAEEKFRDIYDPRDENALQGEPRVVLKELATKVLNDAARDSEFCEFMRLIMGESGRFPELAEPLLDGLTRYLSSRTELGLKDPEATARTFAGTIIYFVILQRVLGGQAMMPMESDRLVTTLVDLIAPEP
jgi:AcrR family transcriptional regulator